MKTSQFYTILSAIWIDTAHSMYNPTLGIITYIYALLLAVLAVICYFNDN